MSRVRFVNSFHETVPADPKRAFATEVVSRLRAAGFRALWAGGCVRDLMLGEPPSDYDVATDAVPEQVMRLFRRTVTVGLSFGVVRVLGPQGAGEVEVATFRSDGRYLDGRRPETVCFGNPAEDAARRDFTINGMFFDPIEGALVDLVGGRDDLQRGVVRAIGDPAARFEEDKLRLLRAIRFAARFGFALEPATRDALERMAPQIRVVAVERIAQELRRMLVHPRRAAAMRLCADVGLLAAILPPIDALRGRTVAAGGREVDAWAHTLAVLDALPTDPPVTFTLAFAALAHEAGESPDRAETGGGPPLDERGGDVAGQLAGALRLANAERERIVWLVRHRRALRGVGAVPAHVRKPLLASEGIDELIALHCADAIATGERIGPIEEVARYRESLPEGPLDPAPLINGDDLKRLGLSPGPEFKSILDEVRRNQLDGIVKTREEALARARELADRGSRPGP
jgi:poly(A) polymerase